MTPNTDHSLDAIPYHMGGTTYVWNSGKDYPSWLYNLIYEGFIVERGNKDLLCVAGYDNIELQPGDKLEYDFKTDTQTIKGNKIMIEWSQVPPF